MGSILLLRLDSSKDVWKGIVGKMMKDFPGSDRLFEGELDSAQILLLSDSSHESGAWSLPREQAEWPGGVTFSGSLWLFGTEEGEALEMSTPACFPAGRPCLAWIPRQPATTRTTTGAGKGWRLPVPPRIHMSWSPSCLRSLKMHPCPWGTSRS